MSNRFNDSYVSSHEGIESQVFRSIVHGLPKPSEASVVLTNVFPLKLSTEESYLKQPQDLRSPGQLALNSACFSLVIHTAVSVRL